MLSESGSRKTDALLPDLRSQKLLHETLMAGSASSDGAQELESEVQTGYQWSRTESAAFERILGSPVSFSVLGQSLQESRTTVEVNSWRTPARVLVDVNLFVGDMEHAKNVWMLRRHRIAAVVNVSTKRLLDDRYRSTPRKLVEAGIAQLLLHAEDGWDFDIILVMERAMGFIWRVLEKSNGGVLVCCDSGMNRSGAVCTGYLTQRLHMPLCMAIEQLRNVKRSALRNPEFIKQLILYCSAHGLPLQ